MALKISRYMPAIIAWMLLLGVTGAFYYLVIPGFVEQFKIVGIVLSILEMLLFIFVVANFLAATVMDPGVVPKASELEEQQHNEFRTPLYKTTDIQGISVRMKWCVTCHFYRPPRCSHCSVCDHCIDSFDHHCPWLNNCIGRRNYRHFFVFLLTLTVHIICVFFFCFGYTLRMKMDLMTKENIGSMIIMVVSGVIFMPIIGLASFHVFLVSTGRTTNEQVTGKYRSGYNPFNKGMFRNVAVVCCGAQYPRFIDHVGRQQIPDLDSFHAALESDAACTAVPAGDSRHMESHQVHVYTPEDERGPGGIKKLGPDGVLEYKPLKKQPLDLLKPTLDAEDRGSNAGDISRDSSMVTIRRFPKLGGGVGEDDSVLGFGSQGSKCNLLDENESAFDAPLVNFRRNPAVAAAASGDVELGIMESAEHRHRNERYSSPGNDKYQQMLKEAYGNAPNSKQSTPKGDGILKNGPTADGSSGINRTRPIAGGGQKFAYVPASALQQSSIVNKSQSMDALKMNNVPTETSPNHGEQLVHSSIPPRLATADANYKRPLSFTQAVQLHDSLTQAKADPKSGGKRAGTGNVNEIRV